jgi:hypothetical protein
VATLQTVLTEYSRFTTVLTGEFEKASSKPARPLFVTETGARNGPQLLLPEFHTGTYQYIT